ncbi:MAG: hypothetical protein QJR03_14655 [Sphaerobacter sp.]|nr:hypothetical protein [Sphaerobacter sp.]
MSEQPPKPAETTSVAVSPAEPGPAEAAPPSYGGVSWEEVRKGQPPKTIKNPDEALLYDRFTSQFSLVNMPGGKWQPVRPLFKPE